MSVKVNPHPLSLWTLGEGRYRIEMDEAWDHERPEFKKGDRHWYEMIPCRSGGYIRLFWDEKKLLLIYIGKAIARKVLKEVKGALQKSIDSEGMDVIFPAEALHQVAEIASARRRRRLNPDHKAKFLKAGKTHRFAAKNIGTQGEKSARKIEPLFDLSKLTAIGQAQVDLSTEAPNENI
jgi:hypothetical protein